MTNLRVVEYNKKNREKGPINFFQSRIPMGIEPDTILGKVSVSGDGKLFCW